MAIRLIETCLVTLGQLIIRAQLRDECLNPELFTSLYEARVVIEKWRTHYNQERPHGALDYRTPSQALGQTPEVLAAENPTT